MSRFSTLIRREAMLKSALTSANEPLRHSSAHQGALDRSIASNATTRDDDRSREPMRVSSEFVTSTKYRGQS